MTGRGNWSTGSASQYQEHFEYDSAGRLWRTNSGDGNVKVALYNLQGQQTSQLTSSGTLDLGTVASAQAADALGNSGVRRTDTQRDLLGRVVAQVLPQRQDSTDQAAYRPVVYMGYDRWGNVVSQTDVRNSNWVTLYSYNANNQVVMRVQPDGNGITSLQGNSPVTRLYYDALGRQVAIRDANNHVNSQIWDSDGNLTAELHADGGYVTHRYDAFGEQTQQIDAEGGVTDYVYDSGGRLRSTINENVGVYDSNGTDVTGSIANRYTGYSYDYAGRKISETDGSGATTHYQYDLRGNLISSTDADGFTTRAAFDAQGHQTASEDANGSVATWGYDVFGELQSHTDIGGASYWFHYDAARELTGQGNTRGQNLAYTYDAAGQLVTIQDNAIGQTTTYAYNAAGQHVLERTVQGGVTYQDQTIGYDTLGRQSLVTGMDGIVLQTAYDAVGNKLLEHASYATTLGDVQLGMTKDLWYAYDSMNRQILVDGAVDGNAQNLANINANQGHILAYDHNGNRIQDMSWGTQVVPEYTQNYDESGTPLGAPVLTGYSTQTGIQTRWYGYDHMNRLETVSTGAYEQVQTGQVQTGTDESNNPIYTPTYGTVSAPRAQAIVLDTRQYDGNSRVVRSGNTALPPAYVSALTQGNTDLSGATTTTIDYDAAGRVISRLEINNADSTRNVLNYYQQFTPTSTPSASDSPAVGGASGYDAAGNLLTYRTVTTAGHDFIIQTTSVGQTRMEGYKETGQAPLFSRSAPPVMP